MSVSTVYIPKHPKEFGPGVWTSLHILGFNAKTPDEQTQCCKYIRIICGALPCLTCRQHAMEFINSNPPEYAVSIDPKSLFKWTCDLHNNANRIRGVPQLNWSVIYTAYSDNNPKCEGDCSNDITPKSTTVTPITTTKIANNLPLKNNSAQPKMNTSVQPKTNTFVQPKMNTFVQPKMNTSVQPKTNNILPPKMNKINITNSPKINVGIHPKINQSSPAGVTKQIQQSSNVSLYQKPQ